MEYQSLMLFVFLAILVDFIYRKIFKYETMSVCRKPRSQSPVEFLAYYHALKYKNGELNLK